MSALMGMAKGAVLLCDVINAIEALNKVQENPTQTDVSVIRISTLITRVIALGFTCCETELRLTGAKASTLMTEKEYELASKVIAVLFRVTEEMISCDGSTKGIMRAVEKGMLAPTIDLCKVALEAEMYHEKHFLEMSPEELAKATRPIYESDGDDGVRIVGYRPVEIEECKTNMAGLEKAADLAAFAKVSLEIGAPSTFVRTGGNIYQHLADFFYPRPQVQEQHPQIIAQQPPQAALQGPPQIVQEVELEEISLVDLTAIPQLLQNDPVFSRNICAISNLPIRNPVGDPNGITLYERSMIMRWLRIRNISPVTNQPLFPHQLIPKPALKAQIDHRLGFHQGRLMAYMESPEFQLGLNAPVDLNLEAAANLENPIR